MPTSWKTDIENMLRSHIDALHPNVIASWLPDYMERRGPLGICFVIVVRQILHRHSRTYMHLCLKHESRGK